MDADKMDYSLVSAVKHLQISGCSIVVIGSKHAGKSTLVNEILGTPILLTELPEDSTPYITRIRNSESCRLRLLTKDETVLDEKTFTSRENLRDEYRNNVRYRRERTRYIDILLPIPGFKGNSMIIDTQHIYHVRELVDILANSPPVYAFVMVVDGTSWDCTASTRDTAFNLLLESVTKKKLQATQHENTQTMFVVNKLDLMAEKQKSQEAEEKRCAMKREIINTWECIEEKNIFHLSAKHPQSGIIPKTEFGKFRNALSKLVQTVGTVAMTQGPAQSTMPNQNIEECLKKEYQALSSEIQVHDTDVKEKLFARMKWRRGMDIKVLFQNQLSDLERKECSIVVVGETSAGKTTLINRILHRDVFTPHNLAATATVTRIRHSVTPQIKIYTKDEKLMKDIPVELSEMKQKLDECTDCSKIPESLRDAYYVDVFLPISDFQGNVYLVDTPGIGTNSHLNEVLFDFLPNAGSFIFVIDATAADNPSRNNFLSLIRRIAESSHEMPCFNPESVVFLTNKWDLVRTEKEKKVISTRLEKRLFKEWHTMSNANLFKVSLKEVNEQKTTPHTIEYREFENRLKETITAYQNKRLHTHTRFLDQLTKDLCHVFDSIIESEEQLLQIMKKSLNSLKEIRSYCWTECGKLCGSIPHLQEELAKKLHSHLTCIDGMNDILSPSGSDISHVPIRLLTEKIPELFSNGVQRWCQQYETRTKIDKIDGSIEEFFTRVKRDIAELKGYPDAHPSPSLSEVTSSEVQITPVSLPPKEKETGNFLKSVFSTLWQTAAEKRERLTEDVYRDCLKSLTRETIKKSFHDSYANCRLAYLEQNTDKYLTKLEKLEKELRGQIESITINLDKLFSKRVSLNENIQRIEEIKCVLDL